MLKLSRHQPNQRFQGLEAKKTDIHQRLRHRLNLRGRHTWQEEPNPWREAEPPSPTPWKKRMQTFSSSTAHRGPPTAACSPFQNYQISKNYRRWVAYNHNCFDHIGQACISISGNYRGRGHLLHSFNSPFSLSQICRRSSPTQLGGPRILDWTIFQCKKVGII